MLGGLLVLTYIKVGKTVIALYNPRPFWIYKKERVSEFEKTTSSHRLTLHTQNCQVACDLHTVWCYY